MGFTDRASVGLVLALLFGVAVCPTTAEAEDVDAILKKGNDLRRRGRDREALAEFQRAAQINETPRVTAQIALAEQALGLWVEAETHMTKALADPRDPWIAKNRPTLEGALRTVREHVGTIEVWGAPDGAEVLLDGKPVGRLPSVGPISFASDEVAAQIRTPGYVETSRTIRVRMGAAVREHVELRRVPPPAPSVALAPEPVPKPSDPAPPNGLRTEGAPDVSTAASSTRTPLVLGAAGLAAAALAFGIVEHLAWRKKVDSFGTMRCDADLSDRGGAACGQIYDDGNRARNFAFVGYGVAGALAATSVILYVTRPTASSMNGAHLACAVAPSPAGIGCAMRF